jgi:hypothetical protein
MTHTKGEESVLVRMLHVLAQPSRVFLALPLIRGSALERIDNAVVRCVTPVPPEDLPGRD